MTSHHHADIVIFGAGIAGLWLHARLRSQGYNALLLETHAVGGGQSIASQGIIHSGLKYAFAGKVNKLAKSISAMPDRWRACLNGTGELDLSATDVSTQSQILMIPSGLMGGLVKLVTKKVLGGQVREIPKSEWPNDIVRSGFKGQLVYMDEPVLNVPSLVRALCTPYHDSIRRIEWDDVSFDGKDLHIGKHTITADHFIFTAAGNNHAIATSLGHDTGLKTQARPLRMGMLRPAPFALYAHLVGQSDKPVATITTHKDKDGTLVWYLGGGVAERAKESDPLEVYKSTIKGLTKYLPKLDLSNVQWNSLPIDRFEGKSDKEGWMPDTPVIHSHGTYHYCWPTKLTFSPLLADKVFAFIGKPSGKQANWNFLEKAPYASAVWDKDDDWTNTAAG